MTLEELEEALEEILPSYQIDTDNDGKLSSILVLLNLMMESLYLLMKKRKRVSLILMNMMFMTNLKPMITEDLDLASPAIYAR